MTAVTCDACQNVINTFLHDTAWFVDAYYEDPKTGEVRRLSVICDDCYQALYG